MSLPERVCAQIAHSAGKAFSCAMVGDYVRVRTPYLYPDGAVVDLYLRESDGSYSLSDLGEALRWLSAQSTGERRTEKQLDLIRSSCRALGVRFGSGVLSAEAATASDLPDALHRLGQAAIRAGDVFFTFRPRAAEESAFADEVEKVLAIRDVPYSRGVRELGFSGMEWHLDFKIVADQKISLVQALSAASSREARRETEHAVASWLDLRRERERQIAAPLPGNFVSVFDDRSGIWHQEHWRQLSGLSEVALWSDQDKFIQIVA